MARLTRAQQQERTRAAVLAAARGEFAEHGYASLRIDLRGSGSSDGVLLDEYAEREQQDVCEALAWVASQPWCTGSVGFTDSPSEALSFGTPRQPRRVRPSRSMTSS